MPDAPGENLPVLAPIKHVRKFEQDKRKSNREVLRRLKRYLLLLEQGVLYYRAVKEAGLTPAQLAEYRKSNPQFADAEKVARSTGVEIVEQKLLDLATAENPNLAAIEMYLKANDDRYNPKKADEHHAVLVVAVTAANVIERIQLLKEELERRDHDIPQIFRDTNPFLNPDIAPIDPDEVVVDAEVVDDA